MASNWGRAVEVAKSDGIDGKQVRSNPPFHPSISTVPRVAGASFKLVRGSMISTTNIIGQPLYRMFFLFNPEEITISYSIDQKFQQDSITPSAAGLVGNVSNAIQINFLLFFDRTYEVRGDPNNLGLLEDVGVFDRMVGSTQPIPNTANPTVDDHTGLGLISSAVRVTFGSIETGAVPFAYNGYISDAGWTFTHFTNRMIPYRGKLKVTLTEVFVAPKTVDIPEDVSRNTPPAARNASPAGIPGTGFNSPDYNILGDAG